MWSMKSWSRKASWVPALRLLPTTAATTLRGPDMVIDGPFAETKEQLLGFYVIDVPDLEAALAVATELSAANPDQRLRDPAHSPVCAGSPSQRAEGARQGLLR